MQIKLTEKNLKELRWRLTTEDKDTTPLEAVGAWLWSHTDKGGDEIIKILGLQAVPQPQGGYKIKEVV